MTEKPETNDFEGEVVKPPSLDERMPHPLESENPIQEGATVKVYEFPQIDKVNIDPADFTVNPLHALARQKEIDDRKHTEPMKCIAAIQRDIADIENLHVLHLDKVSNVRKLSGPHFQSIEREMKRLKSILGVPK